MCKIGGAMSLSTRIRHEFYAVSQNITDDQALQQRPFVPMHAQMFAQILRPIKRLFDTDPYYANIDMSLSDQMRELRQMCQEVQAAQTTTDRLIKARRTLLLGTLQGLSEALEEMEEKGILIAEIDFEDLHAFTECLDILMANAVIYKEFMRSPQVAEAMHATFQNLKEAQNRFWMPYQELNTIPPEQAHIENHAQQQTA